LLLVRAGQPVAVGEMVDVLWGRRAPDSAVNVIRRHVGALRRLLEPGLPSRAAGRWLVRGAGGYRLLTDAGSLDLLHFRELRHAARRAAADGAPGRSVPLLTEALALWRGPAASGLAPEARAHAAFTALDREHLEAVREAADTALRAGLPEVVLGELRRTAAENPLDEPLLARLVRTLTATGHTSEALTAYDTAVARLADELGIDPGPELRAARRAAVHGGAEAGPVGAGAVRESGPAGGAVPESGPTAETVRETGITTGSPETAADTGRHGSAPAHPGPGPAHSGSVSARPGTSVPARPQGSRASDAPRTPPASGPGPGVPPDTPAGSSKPSAGPPPDPSPDASPSPGTAAAPFGPLPVPAQLPHDLPTFTGRRAELDEALALLEAGAPGPGQDPAASAPGGTVVIGAIGGMAGIGKTTLAVHWAHRVADRFPDGQLYVNLRGFDPSGAVLGPGEAVRGFLDTLGVPPSRVPHGPDAQLALYRSLLAGRRFLVLLDNARDTEQVRPLLPGTPGCLTIVTSRDRLSGLIAVDGARPLTLRPLGTDQAREFLVRRLGDERVTAEPGAADEIADLCAGLPLALACVAARAATHPHFPLAAVAAELREAHGSLDAFARTDAAVDVGAVFSWSSGALSAGAARLFPLLALHPGPDFSVPATAALAGLPVREARQLLAELSRGHLVNEHLPGRYAFHDLLRAHATELADARLTAAGRRAAVHRLFAHHLHTAHAAGLLLAPHADPLPPDPAPEGTVVVPLADDREALDWLTAEYPVLTAVVDRAAGSGLDRLACLLAWALEPYFDRRGHWHDWAAAQRTALDAALRRADPALEARGLRGLARAEGRLGLHTRAVARLGRALELFTELGDDIGRANTHRSLGWECEQRGDLPGALRHNRLALDVFRATGQRAARASVLNSVGWYHALLGSYDEALEHCLEALDMLRELGDRYGQASTWDSVAYAYHHLGRHPQAVIGYRNALTLYQDLGVPYLEASTLVHIGDTHHATGDDEAAHEAWRRALAVLTGLGHPDADDVRARLRGDGQRRDLA
jgi:DNA-binding SARP family transcriptional activator/tetratricopeptide (TPR) repeat protein